MLSVAQYFVSTRFANIYEGRVWAAIALACLGLWVALQRPPAWALAFSACASLLVYAGIVWRLRLVPDAVLAFVRSGLPGRRGDGPNSCSYWSVTRSQEMSADPIDGESAISVDRFVVVVEAPDRCRQ